MASTAGSSVDPLRILLRRKSELRIASKVAAAAAVVESIESEHTVFQFVCLSVCLSNLVAEIYFDRLPVCAVFCFAFSGMMHSLTLPAWTRAS